MYKCLQNIHVGNSHLSSFDFQPIDQESMEPIRLWRNAQIDILRQKEPLTKEDQIRYFNNVLIPSFSQDHPSQILWQIKRSGTLIGYGGLVHIDWNDGKEDGKAEISFLLDDAIHEGSVDFKEAFFAFVTFLKKIAFEGFKFRKLSAEIYHYRHLVIALLEHSGFMLEGTLQAQICKKGCWQDSLLYGLLRPQHGPNVLVTSISKKVPLLLTVKKAMKLCR